MEAACFAIQLRARFKSAERIVCEKPESIAVSAVLGMLTFENAGAEPASRRGAFTELDAAQKVSLADILKQVTTRYDNLFQTSFPYTMGGQIRRIRNRTRIGTFMRISIRLCCDLRPYENLWSGLKCWECRNATSRQKAQPRDCASP